jgi:hypothetical protein
MLKNIFTHYSETVFSHTNVPTSHMRAPTDQLLHLVPLCNFLVCPNDYNRSHNEGNFQRQRKYNY